MLVRDPLVGMAFTEVPDGRQEVFDGGERPLTTVVIMAMSLHPCSCMSQRPDDGVELEQAVVEVSRVTYDTLHHMVG